MNRLNGYSIALAGAEAAKEAAKEPPAPIVGARRCNVTRPLTVDPDHRGRVGRGWRVDIAAARRKMPPGAPPDAVVVHWIVEAPWSSEVIHSYSLVCVHLRHDFRNKPITRYLEGATHEIALMAINPQVERALMLTEPIPMDAWLSPGVFAAQIIALSDEAAAARVAHTVELICDGRLSPHPTHVRSWVELFGDNMLRRAGAPANAPEA